MSDRSQDTLADLLEAGLGLLPEPDQHDSQDSPEHDMAQNNRAVLSDFPGNDEAGTH